MASFDAHPSTQCAPCRSVCCKQDDEEGEEEEQEGFYCVACDKSFKSEKQLHNHERSVKGGREH